VSPVTPRSRLNSLTSNSGHNIQENVNEDEEGPVEFSDNEIIISDVRPPNPTSILAKEISSIQHANNNALPNADDDDDGDILD